MCTPTHRITAPFSPLDMHPHPSNLAFPQTPHLAPPPFPAYSALNPTRPNSPQGHLARPANWDSMTRIYRTTGSSRQPQDAIRTDAALPEPLNSNGQGDEPWAADTSTQLPTRALGTLTSPTRPPGYSNMTKSKRRRLREHDSRQRTNEEKSAEGSGGGS